MNNAITSLYEKTPYFINNLLGIVAGMRKYIQEKHYSVFRDYMSELTRSQWFDYQSLEELQFDRFKKVLNHAYRNVAYYEKVFSGIGLHPDDIRQPADIKHIPFLCKNDIKTFYESLFARNVKRNQMLTQGTSGTTGSPSTVAMDRNTLIWEKAWIMRHRQWGGFSKSDWRASFGGHRIVPLDSKKPPFWRYNIIGKQILFSTYHMTPHTMPFYIDRIRNSRVKFIDGYPSTIYILAKYLKSTNRNLPMKAVFTGAEPIFDYQREVIETAFCCKIFDHYGLTEKVVSAGECEAHEGRHVTMEGTFVEIIPIKGENGYGEIVGTSLVNYAMPLIRYRTGDMSELLPEECRCGRKLIRIRPVETKMEDIITTPEGNYISASNLTFAFKKLPTIHEAQIVQEDTRNIRIRIIKGNGYSEEDGRYLIEGLYEALGRSVKLEIEYVDEIERTRTGKFRFVISKVPFKI